MMAMAARFGGVQPEAFATMDWDEARELVRRLSLMHQEEQKTYSEIHVELTKAVIKTIVRAAEKGGL